MAEGSYSEGKAADISPSYGETSKRKGRPPKNDPRTLSRQQDALRRSFNWRRTEGYDELWERMRDLYRGKHYNKKSEHDRAVVNRAFSTKNVIAPSVAINNPKFTVKARREDNGPQAIITEQVLNYLWRVGKYQDEFRLAVDDFLEIGHGWVKVGWKATKAKKIKPVPDANHEGMEEPDGVDDRDETVPGNVESEVSTFGENTARPFAERVSPFDMFCDPDARHPKEMRWVAQRIRRPVADVQVDERYEKKVREKISALIYQHRIDDQNRHLDGHPTEVGDVPFVDIWEFYDIRKGTVSTFVLDQGVGDAGKEGFLIPPMPMPYAFGHPFVMLRNYEVIDMFYPMGELEAVEDLQYELNDIHTDTINHRKSYIEKYIYDPNMLSKDSIDALRSNEHNTMVPIDNTQGDIKEAIMPLPQRMIQPEMYAHQENITQMFDETTGVFDYQRGGQEAIRRTATEAAMIQDALNARSAEKLSRIESSLARIGERLISLMQQYMTGQMVMPIVGMQSAPLWLQFDADYIQGEFDFEVEAGSTQPNNESFRRQAALQLVDAMMPFLQLGVVDPAAIARHVLQFGFDIKDPSSFMLQPMVDPMTGQPMGPAGPMPPQAGGTIQMPGVGEPIPEDRQSPIPGIPIELASQLQGQFGLNPAPQPQAA